MIEVNDLSSRLFEYLLEVVELSKDELLSLKSALFMIKEKTPSDSVNIFNKMENLVSASSDISWLITSATRKKISLVNDLRKIKDPQFVYLVRQGRPSNAAIEAEIRISTDGVQELENQISTLDNLIDYLKSISGSLDKYIWLLKDKLSYNKNV